MRRYELSISPNYVPDWGVVEAVREFFQNGIDEATRDPDNDMFFNYDADKQIMRIGNKHGKLDPKTLLFGYTEKNDQSNMLGNYGEGYKIATVVLLRLNKQIVFYNYGYRQVWYPRFVNSRKYGTTVPTFFVDTKYIWQKVPDNDLVIEITGITSEEYNQIVESNLHFRVDYDSCEDIIHTDYGDILKDDKYKGKIFVGGLYIQSDIRLDIGLNFKSDVVRLERDRSMVNGFDVQWYASRMIEQSNDITLINSSLSSYAGKFITYSGLNSNQGDHIAQEFLEEYGYDAVPVSNEKDNKLSISNNTVIVSEVKRDIILESEYYQFHSKIDEISEDYVLYNKMIELGKVISKHLSEGDLIEYLTIAQEVKELEDKLKDYEVN